MGIYNYRAVGTDGSIVSGRLPALNPRELETRLAGAGLELLKARPSRRAMLFKSRPPRRELINFCMHMETTLKAGLMITEALQDQVDSLENRSFRDILSVVNQAVADGTSFSAALASFPDAFDEVFVGMIRSGEESGQLGQAFENLSENLRWQDELASNMKRMIMYPAFTIAVLVGVTTFMLVFLVPELSGFIMSMNKGDLPLQTLILVKLSEFVRTYWWQLLISPIFIWIAVVIFIRVGGAVARRQLDAMKLKIPIIGPILNKILLSRFCSMLGMLYEAGLPLMSAMSVARDSMTNRVLSEGIDKAITEIEFGRGITDAFAKAELFPNLMLRMIKVGESTGEVNKGLKSISYFYDRDIKESIGRIEAMVEPMLTLVLGLLLGWLMTSVLGPIYDILSKVGT
ncbi:MAG: type II secretion system F family protein [Burkholderiaceae bacterium]